MNISVGKQNHFYMGAYITAKVWVAAATALVTLFMTLALFVPTSSADYNINTFSPESPWILTPTGEKVLKVDPAGNHNVVVQDQHTGTIILPMVHEVVSNTIAVDTVIGEYTATLDSATGFIAGQHIRIINSAADRFYFGTIISISLNVVTLDNPIDFVYIAGSEVTGSNTNLAVDGSTTPVIYTLRTGSPSIPASVDITRVLMTCISATAVDLSKFGDLTALTKGLVLQRVDGTVTNIFNIKTNLDIASIAYDWTPFLATNPAQGVDGFASRITFAGQSKIGVSLRITQFDNVRMLVQDNISGLTVLNVYLEGHVVE